MRKFKKRILGFLGSFIMLLSIFPLNVSAESTDLPVPAHSKTILANEDGTYTLNLDVTGRVESQTTTTPADILLIVDTSGSMGTKIGDWGSPTRLEKIEALVNHLADKVIGEGSQNQMAIVRFSGQKGGGYRADIPYNDSSAVLAWTNSKGAVATAMDDLEATGGTNWQAGFREGAAMLNQLSDDRANSKKYVVFLSDGNPTFHYDEKGMTQGTGSSGSADMKTETEYAVSEAKKIENAIFYSVGIGGSTDRMSGLADTLGGTYANGVDEAALDAAFEELISLISKTYINVTISDTLSENAEMVDPDNIQVSAKNEDGTDAVLPESRPSYNEETKTITWSLGEKFELAAGATYTMSFEVRPTQLAKDKYAEAGNQYTDIGEEGTGETSAGQPGFFSNDGATVGYIRTHTDQTEVEYAAYAKPVLQVPAPPITELPNAGGLDAGWLITLLGGLVMAFAGALLVARRRYKA